MPIGKAAQPCGVIHSFLECFFLLYLCLQISPMCYESFGHCCLGSPADSLADSTQQSQSVPFIPCPPSVPCQEELWAQMPLSLRGEHRLWWHNQGQGTFSPGAIYFQASAWSLRRDENHSVNCLLLSPIGGPWGLNIKAPYIFTIPPSVLSKDIWQAHKSAIVSTWTLKKASVSSNPSWKIPSNRYIFFSGKLGAGGGRIIT